MRSHQRPAKETLFAPRPDTEPAPGCVPISSGWVVGLAALQPPFPNIYRGKEGASSALRNLSQAVNGLAHWAPTILGHTPCSHPPCLVVGWDI